MLGIEPAQEPLDRKEFNKHFDGLLITGKLNPEILDFMSRDQQMAINEVKKSLARLEKKTSS